MKTSKTQADKIRWTLRKTNAQHSYGREYMLKNPLWYDSIAAQAMQQLFLDTLVYQKKIANFVGNGCKFKLKKDFALTRNWSLKNTHERNSII